MMTNPEKKQQTKETIRDHLANERTFLAWVRTSLAIIGFGFIIEKFSSAKGSDIAGILLIGLGSILTLLSYARFRQDQQHIEQGRWSHTSRLNLLLALIIFFIGIFLLVYLIN